jgi:antitoxin YefM
MVRYPVRQESAEIFFFNLMNDYPSPLIPLPQGARKMEESGNKDFFSSLVKENITMTTYSASEARKRLFNLVDEVKDSHKPVQIIGKRNSAILISEEDWRAIEETLYLTSIPGMRESINKGLKTPVEKCEEEINW